MTSGKTKAPRNKKLIMSTLVVVIVALLSFLNSSCDQKSKRPVDQHPVFSGTVTDNDGKPVSGARITINSVQAKSDDRGRFKIEGEREERYIVNITHPDYADISYVTRRGFEDVTWCLVRAQIGMVDAGRPIRIVDRRPELLNSGRRGAIVTLPANSLFAPNGEPVRGEVRAAMATLDIERGQAPGDWAVRSERGDRDGYLLSYGAAFLRFSDASGEVEYQLGKQQTAEIEIPVTPSMRKQATKTQRIQLWHYDMQDGYWKRSGAAAFDPGRMSYVGKVNHLSTTNTDIAKFDNAACLKITLDPSVPLGNKLRIRYHSGGTAFGQAPTFVMSDTDNAAYRLPASTNVLLELLDASEVQFGNLVAEDPLGTPTVNNVVNTGAALPSGANLWPLAPFTPCKPIVLRLADPEVEIQINARVADTERDIPNDDYLTWAPTFSRARLRSPMPTDVNIVLTNDNPASILDGGNVRFAALADPWPANTTATATTLSLTLPASGAWVPFVVAGEFESPSHNDKDTIIEARQNTATGTVRGTKALMVRVRKNANTMADAERDRFLFAMRNFRNKPSGGFLLFQELHRLASLDWAGDEAHQQPAFYPWHRAMLLHVERELQAIDPSVALPYWDWDAAAPNLFAQDFIGGPGSGPSFIAEPVFAFSNPLRGWNTDLPFSSGELRRNERDHTAAPSSFTFMPLDHPVDTDLMSFVNFGPNTGAFSLPLGNDFSGRGERRSHNPGHTWPCAGGHLRFPMRSAADPLFYLLHSQVDRQWAYWQRDPNTPIPDLRFGASAPKDYDNTGNWNDPANSGILDPTGDFRQKGSFLNDGMWPWDGTSGPAFNPAETRPFNQEPVAESGTVQAATSTSVTLRSGASSVDDVFNSYSVRITSGTGSGQEGTILAYNGSSKVASITPPWATTPNATSNYVIESENIPVSRPTIPMSAFPQSTVRYLWPSSPVQPRPLDMIDYLGRADPTQGLSFCYEDVPY